MVGSYSCHAQKKKHMDTKNNPLLCDTATGICELPAGHSGKADHAVKATVKPVKIIYFTDPICSSCWGIEPQLRRLKLEYGSEVEIEYRMGGLLPDWSYNSGGISKPSDVAHHWDEVSQYYKMPIDGDVWLEDPLSSSYPPSIAFKAAQMQDQEKAVVFLRNIREMVFLQKKNITKWDYLERAGLAAGLDPVKLKRDYEGKARELFHADLDIARKMGVRGFPTIFVTSRSGASESIYGAKPYEAYGAAIHKVYKGANRQEYATDWNSLFNKYPSLTAREYAELSNITILQAGMALQNLVAQGELTQLNTKNGSLWMKK